MFEMTALQADLLDALTTLKGDFASKPNFDYDWEERDFNRRTENQVKVVGEYNRLRFISPLGSEIRIAGNADVPGTFVLPFWSLFAFIKALGDTVVDISEKAGAIQINCGTSTTSSWMPYPVETFPIKDDDDARGEAVLTLTPDWLAGALARALPFTAKGKSGDSRRNVYFTQDINGRMMIEVANASTLIQIESPFYMPKTEGIILDRDAAAALLKMSQDADSGTVTLYQNELDITADFRYGVTNFKCVPYPRNWTTQEEFYPNWSAQIATSTNGASIRGWSPRDYNLAGLLEVGDGFKTVTISNLGVTVAASDGGSINRAAPIQWNIEFQYALAYPQLLAAAKAISVNSSKAEAAWEVLHAAWSNGANDPTVTHVAINPERRSVWLQRGCVSVYLSQELPESR